MSEITVLLVVLRIGRRGSCSLFVDSGEGAEHSSDYWKVMLRAVKHFERLDQTLAAYSLIAFIGCVGGLGNRVQHFIAASFSGHQLKANKFFQRIDDQVYILDGKRESDVCGTHRPMPVAQKVHD